MKLIFSFVLICFQCLPSYAQWKKLGSPTAQDLYDIQMRGPVGYIAGQNSTVLKSSDSGRTWKSLALTIPTHLRSLYFIDSSIGFVSGENARIQKTNDGGKTWSQKYVRTAGYLYAIRFSNNFGIAVGKDMLAVRSDDFGETWQVDTTFKSNKRLNSVCILPNGICWAVGDSGYMIKKHLSEKKWEVIKYPGKIDLNHISNFGDSVLIVAGGMPDSTVVGVHHNIFLRSLDSGKTWASTTMPEMKTILAAWFSSKDTGFLAGSNGIISKSYDPFNKRGQQFPVPPTASNLSKIFSYNNGVGLIVGDGGIILRTTNNGGFGLSILSPQTNPHIQLYPNPCGGNFSIISDETIVSVSVYDVFGRLISQETSGDMNQIHIGSKGIYMVCVELANGSKSIQKLMVN